MPRVRISIGFLAALIALAALDLAWVRVGLTRPASSVFGLT